MSPSSKKLRLALSAFGGLACGLLIRHNRAAEHPSPLPSLVAKSAAGDANPVAAPDEWGPLLDSYLKLPPPACAQSADKGSKAESAAFLRMLLRPVTRDTIHEGISFLNGTDTTRYWVVLPSLFAHWAKSNPDAVLNTLEELRDPQSRNRLVWETFHALAATDAREALTRARNLPSPMLRSPALHALAATLRPDQMPEILRESMKDALPPLQMREASFQKDALKAWAESDPQAPVKFATGIDDPSWRKEMLETALQTQLDLPHEKGGMGKMDPVTLLELARDFRNVPGITDQIGTLIGRGEPGSAAILAAIPSASDREYVMTDAIKGIFYFLGQENGPDSLKKSAAKGLDNLASETSGQGQSAEFQKAFFDAATYGEVPVFTAATRWLTTHDPAQLDELTAEASARIPFTVAKWLSTLSPSPERDHAVAIFAETHAATDPGRAAAWAESITDPAKRASALAAVEHLQETQTPNFSHRARSGTSW